MQSTLWEIQGWMKHKLKSRLLGKISITLELDDTTLMAESEEKLKTLLMRVKEESEKVDLKLNIQKTEIMVSGPITSWQIDGETMETVTDFIFLGSWLYFLLLPVSSTWHESTWLQLNLLLLCLLPTPLLYKTWSWVSVSAKCLVLLCILATSS